MLIYNMQNVIAEVIFMSVGTNIRQRRYELRLSQQELADAMGYKTRSTIAKIESGENDVSQKKLKKFAEVLNTTVEALISGNAPSSASHPFFVLSASCHASVPFCSFRMTILSRQARRPSGSFWFRPSFNAWS